jgi:hypothetical protein
VSDINKPQKSQTELIVEKFIENLKSHPEFDEKTLSRLSELASSKTLSQYKKIEAAIKPQVGGENEDN